MSTSVLTPVGAMVIGFLATWLMRGKSRTVRMLIGIPSMLAMVVLLLMWVA